jgi:hypothetical protein
MEFKDMPLDQIIKEDCIDEYKRGLDFLWVQVTRLHVNLFILDKIREFPWEFFYGPRTPVFFYQAVRNALDMSILQIVKLAQDQGVDVFNLAKFKDRVQFEYMRPEHVAEFRAQLTACRFDQETRRLLQKAVNLRDRQIAHFLQGERFHLSLDDFLSLDELKSLAEKITALFEVLSFGPRQKYLPLDYDLEVRKPDGIDARPDIVRLLDHLARESAVLNQPETNPIAWAAIRPSLTEAWLDQLNSWRTRLGLPEV